MPGYIALKSPRSGGDSHIDIEEGHHIIYPRSRATRLPLVAEATRRQGNSDDIERRRPAAIATRVVVASSPHAPSHIHISIPLLPLPLEGSRIS